MRVKKRLLLLYLTLFLMIALSACSSDPALTPVSTTASVAPVVIQSMNYTSPVVPTPTIAGYQATVNDRELSNLEGPMVIRLSEFDTLTINVPIPPSASAELVLPTSGHTVSQPAQCPAPGNPIVLASPRDTLGTMRAYLSGGGTVANLEKLLNSQLSLQNGYATEHTSARLFHTDVTGDTVPDVLIVFEAGFRYYPSTVSLFFLQCRDGRYNGEALAFSEGRVFGKSNLGILSIQDANDNGVPEIAFTYEGVPLIEGKPQQYTHTLEWNGNQLVSFVNP